MDFPPLDTIQSAFADVDAYHQKVDESLARIREDHDAIWEDQRALEIAVARQRLSTDESMADSSLKIAQDTARLQKEQHEAQQVTNDLLARASASNNEMLAQLVRMYERFLELVNSGALKKEEEPTD